MDYFRGRKPMGFNKSNKFFSFFWALLWLVLVFSENAWADKKVVKLGFVADITGPGFLIALSQKNALELGTEEINSTGGLLGKKVELVIRDSQLKPELGAVLARDLILKEKVDFLIGPTSSAVAQTVSQVCKEYKKLIYFHAANNDTLTDEQGHRYLYQVIPNTYMEGQAIALYLSKKPYKRIAIIGPNIEYGQSQARAFKKKLSELNPSAQIVKEVWTKLGEQDYGPAISSLLSGRPEIIYTSLWSGDLAGFIRQARANGLLQQVRLLGLFDYDLLKGLGNDMVPNLFGFDRVPFYGLHNPQMKAFVEKYKARTGEFPSEWSVTVYDGLMALRKAVEKAGTLDTEKVIGALEGLQWESLRGPLFIRPFDHMANCGLYFGVTHKDPKYSFYVMKDVVYIPGQDVWRSAEEIKNLRKQEGK
jgi:branched-chain amino acid transport system substrate-binding protein